MTSSTRTAIKKLSLTDLDRCFALRGMNTDRNLARRRFNEFFSYEDILPCDITALEGYISIELAACRSLGKKVVPELSISRYRKTRPIIRIGETGGIREAYLFCDASYFKGREAISFNADGFIGFCGWADSNNSIPFVAAFCRWLDEWMTPVKSLRAMRNE